MTNAFVVDPMMLAMAATLGAAGALCSAAAVSLATDATLRARGGPMLAAFFAILAVTCWSDLLDLGGFYGSRPWAELAVAPLLRASGLLLAPALWVSVRAATLVRPHRSGWSDAWHGVPAVLAFLVFVPVHMPDDPLRTTLLAQLKAGTGLGVEGLGLVFYTALLLQAGIYLGLATRRVSAHLRRLKDIVSTIEARMLRRLRFMLVLLALPWLSLAVEVLLSRVVHVPEFAGLLGGLFRVTCVAFAAALVLGPRPFLQPTAAERDAEPIGDGPPRYDRSALGAEEARRVAAKLDRAMRIEAVYRDPGLTLRRLSDLTRVPIHRLSQVLNVELGQSFYDYVNGWRVEAAQDLLLEEPAATTLEVAYAVGFNSRSTFNAAFKKATGQTPSSFRREGRPAAVLFV